MQGVIKICRSVVIVCLVLGWILLSSTRAQAVALGDVLPQTVNLRQVKGHAAIDQQEGSRLIRAIANDQNQVFQIEVKSTDQSVPDPQEFLGAYSGFAAEVVQIIPLRAKKVRYYKNNQVADWSVYGQSGNFYALAFSEDLAPQNWGQ